MSLSTVIIILAIFLLVLVFVLPFFRRFFVRAVCGVCVLLIGKSVGICGFSLVGGILSLLLGVPGALTFFALSGILK